MGFVPKVWKNNPVGETPVTAEEMNRIEAGINEAVNLPGLIDNLPAGSVITVRKVNGAWPNRPTGRADITVHWIGPDPDPSIVTTGTSGALDGVDIRFVTP